MLALGLSLSLVLFWTVLGRALLAALDLRVGVLRAWLLAPGVGLAIMVAGLMIGNQAGLPIASFAWPLTVFLAAAATAILVWKRPCLPWRALSPFAAAVLFSVLWTEWPAAKFGFNWISFVTDDFVNYGLAAERFKDFGFYRVPILTELGGSDYAQNYWFMHALGLARFGAEHQLAWMSALIGKHVVQIFMPTIVGLSLAQICAAGGLALHVGRWRRQAQWTAVLLALSPMFIFGSLYQLIAQAGGLCLMLTAIALLTADLRIRRRLRLLALAVPTAFVGAALAVFYPEVAPFAVLTVGLYATVQWIRTRRFPGALAVLLEYSLVGLLVLLRHNLLSFIYTLGGQFVSGVKHVDLSLSIFPFFLIPSGLASVLGLQPFNVGLTDPRASALIALALLLLAAGIIVAIRQAWRPLPLAWLLLVQLALAFQLFRAGKDFGLYKLSMYIQPALMGAMAAGLVSLRRIRWAVPVAAAAWCGLAVFTGLTYTRSSAGLSSGVMREMKESSELLDHRPPTPPSATHWASGIDNIVALKLAANFYRGTDIKFLSRPFFAIGSFLIDSDWPLLGAHPHPEIYPLGHEFLKDEDRYLYSYHTLFGTDFGVPRVPNAPGAYLSLAANLSLFNKLRPIDGEDGALFTLRQKSSMQNWIIFVHSTLGSHYYLGDRRRISFFQQEDNYYAPGTSTNGIGRFFLLRIENPSEPFYLRLAASKTLMGSGHTAWSPTARILAQQTVPLGLVGNGAANRIVGPITPVWVDGVAYLAIDFGQAPTTFPIKRTGLAALYNAQVPLDYRRLIGYGRDISALSPEEVAALPRPRRVSKFPADLASAVGFEYSGIYEDGWLSPEAEFVLGVSRPGEAVRVRGYVPELPGGKTLSGEASVSVDGGPSRKFPTAPGPFDWLLPVTAPGPTTRVRLSFSAVGRLPNGDDRPVGGHLTSLEIVPAGPIDFATAGSMRSPSYGIDQDGWAEKTVAFEVPVSPASADLKLEIEYPGWPGVPAENEVRISIDGAPATVRRLQAGRNSLALPIPPGLSVRRVEVESDRTFQLPPPDGRQRAFRILSAVGAPLASL